MKNQENKIAANKRLAKLLGWTSIIEVGGALVGTPPAGAVSSRGQALVPDWAGDWAAVGPLLVSHGDGMIIEFSDCCFSVYAPIALERHRSRFHGFQENDSVLDRNGVILMAIAQSVIDRLEHAR
ncbi:hypothetical protein [Janthinobacterium lividum]|uniref:hypothetical protein n=1 Tax=Janthinobacterium lividum TaxID=29581 RepID=UPI001595556D|nr:hypothetical protein [Janthinobacterium lividum]QKY08756.1 hypothetical protein G8765_14010 [Janthinobacterium lividum]